MQRRIMIGIVAVSILTIAIYLGVSLQRGVSVGRDAWAYYGAARAVLEHKDLYTAPPLFPNAPPYLYPPLLAVVLAPIAWLPISTVSIIWFAVVSCALLLLIPLLRTILGWKIAILAVLCFMPTWQTLYDAQVDSCIALVLAFSTVAIRANKQARTGFALGIGILLKLTPLVILIALLQKGYTKAFLFAMCLMAACIAITTPILPAGSWTHGMVAAIQSNRADSGLRSLTSIVYTLTGITNPLPGILIAVPFVVATLWRTRGVPRDLGFAAAMIVPLLVARVVWEHQAITVLPALALLWTYNANTRRISIATWLAISVIGTILMPIALSICWVVCLWPSLIGGTDNIQQTTITP